MNTIKAEQFFSTVTQDVVDAYSKYWESIKPKTHEDFLRRYLFAFTSVHTTWASNVRGYNAIKDLGWRGDKTDLLTRLINARCGMHNNRANYIWDFTEKFFTNPEYYCTIQGNWKAYRNELVKSITGLGIAKVSFALEMCFPNEAEVSCIDTHGIQLYSLDTLNFRNKSGIELYEKAEQHWLEKSSQVNASSTISRAIFWDKKQKQPNSRYWTYVLEN